MKVSILWSIVLRRWVVVCKIAGAVVAVFSGLGVLETMLRPVFEVLTEGEALSVAVLLRLLAVVVIIKIARKVLAVG